MMRDKKNLLEYNAEGYYDPTAGTALLNILRARPAGYVKWLGQPIYLCPGDDPDLVGELRLLKRFCRYAASQGAHPLAPCLFYSEVYDLSDTVQIKPLLRWTRDWCKRASEIWVLGNAPMPEMRWDLKQALKHGKTIRFFTEDPEEGFRQLRVIDGLELSDTYSFEMEVGKQ